MYFSCDFVFVAVALIDTWEVGTVTDMYEY